MDGLLARALRLGKLCWWGRVDIIVSRGQDIGHGPPITVHVVWTARVNISLRCTLLPRRSSKNERVWQSMHRDFRE